MNQDAFVLDLGELDGSARSNPAARAKGAHFEGSSAAPVSSRADHIPLVPAHLLASLSIFIPGAGQMFAARLAWGLFFLSTMGFFGALGWAIVATFDRLRTTLDLLGLPAEAAPCALALLYFGAACLHVSGVLHAYHLSSDSEPQRGPSSPFRAGLASLLVPGWGQILNGCYRRGTLFLGSLWASGACWILVSRPVRSTLATFGLIVPSPRRVLWLALALVTAPAVVWALAVYDASMWAATRRHD